MFKIKNKITSEVRTVYYIVEEKDRVKHSPEGLTSK